MKEKMYENLLKANTKLSDEKKYLISDIKVLIAYIKGDIDLEYQVKNLMKKYRDVTPKKWNKYD